MSHNTPHVPFISQPSPNYLGECSFSNIDFPDESNFYIVNDLDDCWQPYANWIRWWFCNDKATPMAQLLISLVWGVLLSPWASGLFFLLVFIIVYEILYYVFTKGDPRYYNVFVRVGVIYASVFGYILGRTLSGDDILYEGVPDMPGIYYS